jgi:spermidine synthase
VGDWYDEVFRDRVRFGLRVVRHLHSERTEFQTIDVVETEDFGRALVLDGIYQTSERDDFYYHEMLVQPAMVVAPATRHVLVIGGGDGGTAREVLRHAEVERVVMVEIDRRVVEVSREFLPTIGSAWDDPRLELVFDDGVRYVGEVEAGSFDVAVLDGSDPVGPSESLFDERFYRGCARVLKPDGVFALQSEPPFWYRDVFLEIQRTLRREFSRVHPYFGPVPLYTASPMSYTLAGARVDPMAIDEQRATRVETDSRYYNREVHRAAFAVPSDLRRELERG